MHTPVSVKDKKNFIEWFLNNYQLKKRESVWILNYLVNHNNLLENVHFIRGAKYCPRSIVITSYCSNEAPFRFYKNQLVTTDPEKSFHDIRLNQTDPIYIELNFKNAYQSISYISVLEDNPFIPKEHGVTKKDRHIAKKLLDQSLYDFKIKLLKQKIDRSLDKRNRIEFLKLAGELHRMKSKPINQPKSKMK